MQKREIWENYMSSYIEKLSDELKDKENTSYKDRWAFTYSKRHKHYKLELEYAALKYLLKEINFPSISIWKSESPDFILGTSNGNIGVEITDLNLIESNNRHKQALLDEMLAKGSLKIVDYGIIDKLIRIEIKPILFEQLSNKTETHIFNELMQKIVDSGFTSDYFGIVELTDNCNGNAIYPSGFRKFDNVTTLDVIKVIEKKEERLVNCYEKVAENSDIKAYWLIIRMPNEIVFPFAGTKLEPLNSKFDKIYLVDYHYNKTVVSIK